MWGVADEFDSRVRDGFSAERPNKMRKIVRNASDTVANPQSLLPIYMPRDPRHTKRELGLYQGSTVVAMEKARCLSVAGPDASKIGESMVVQMAALMNQKTKVSAVATPQVPLRPSLANNLWVTSTTWF